MCRCGEMSEHVELCGSRGCETPKALKERATSAYYQANRKIYFVQCGDFVKIGSADHVGSRLDSLTTGNPYPLKLLAAIWGSTTDERRLHRIFQSDRVKGEWFKFDFQIKEYLKARWVQQETKEILRVDKRAELYAQSQG